MVADAAGALTFGGNHLDDLAPTCNQIGETSRHLIGKLPELRFGCRGEMGDYRRVDRVGLGSFAESHREGAHLCRIDDHHRKAGTSQARSHHRLETASGYDCHQCRRQGFEPGDEILDAGSLALEDATLAGRTNRHVQAILRHIDADHYQGGAAAHTPPRRRINLAMSITARECDPIPISRSPSVARTRNSIRRPSILVTSASPVTMLPTTVGARWRTLISVPTALSLGSR